MKFNIVCSILISFIILCKPSLADDNNSAITEARCAIKDGCRLSNIATEAYKSREYELAFQLFNSSCSQGDSRGCFGVGLMLDEGKGVKQDTKAAKTFYSDSCYNGFATGCFYLGASLRNGKGGDKNLVSSHQYFLKACRDNLAKACFNVAINYYDGLGVSADKAKALHFNEKSCELSEPRACYNLAYMLETPQQDNKTDPQRIKELYQYSCDQGVQEGCENVQALSSASSAARD